MINRPLHQVSWPSPATPRALFWAPFLLFCLLLNLGIVAYTAALSPQQAAASTGFWLRALLPGALAGSLLFALRWFWYELWLFRAQTNERLNAENAAYRERTFQERPGVLDSLLLGPACETPAQRQALAGGAIVELEAVGACLRMEGLGLPFNETPARAEALAKRLAAAMAPWWRGPHKPQGTVAWAGAPAHWRLVRAELARLGVNVPEQADALTSVEGLDVLTDRLFRGRNNVDYLACAGMTLPTEGEPEAAQPLAEAAFALHLAYRGGTAALTRAVQTASADDMARAHRNAGLEAGVPFILMAQEPPAFAGEAGWSADGPPQAPAWGNTRTLAPWVAMISAMDRALLLQKPVGWHAGDHLLNWSGVALPAADKEAVS